MVHGTLPRLRWRGRPCCVHVVFWSAQALQHMPEVKAAMARIAMGESVDPLDLSNRVLHSALPGVTALAAWAAALPRRSQ